MLIAGIVLGWTVAMALVWIPAFCPDWRLWFVKDYPKGGE